MSMWNIQIQESGGQWRADGTIPRPNADLIDTWTSTQVKQQLANGDFVFVTPESRYDRDIATFIWYMDNGTVRTKIRNYIRNHDYIKIIDHNNNQLIGRFVSMRATHLVGMTDTWNLEVQLMLHTWVDHG